MHDATRADLDSIDELHKRDVAATIAGDIDELKALMDPECVLFSPDGRETAGPEYLDKVGRSQLDEAPAAIVELEQDWQELALFGDLAYEQGIVRYAVRRADGKTVQECQRLVRILRRQKDGAWCVYRAIWHEPVAVSR